VAKFIEFLLRLCAMIKFGYTADIKPIPPAWKAASLQARSNSVDSLVSRDLAIAASCKYINGFLRVARLHCIHALKESSSVATQECADVMRTACQVVGPHSQQLGNLVKLIQSILKGIASLRDNIKPWYKRALGRATRWSKFNIWSMIFKRAATSEATRVQSLRGSCSLQYKVQSNDAHASGIKLFIVHFYVRETLAVSDEILEWVSKFYLVSSVSFWC
jgi:hypothetical protein